MKRLFLTLCLCFAIGFCLNRWQEARKGKEEFPSAFSKTSYPLRNRSFVVVMIGRNSGPYAEETIRSVLSQNYEEFRAIYIDDGSTDGSDAYARDTLYAHPASHKALFVQNPQTLGVLTNLLRVADTCFEEEILVVLEAAESLSHEWVLQTLNQYYANPDLWLTCAQSLHVPSFREIDGLPSAMRKDPHAPLYLKTFYATLLKKLKAQDLMHGGKIVSGAYDFTYMVPLMELAEGHFTYLKEPLSLAREMKQKTELCKVYEEWLQEKQPYAPLAKLFPDKELSQ